MVVLLCSDLSWSSSAFQVARMPRGSLPYSDPKAAPSSSSVRCILSGTVPPQRGMSGQTFKLPHLPTNLFVHASHSKI